MNSAAYATWRATVAKNTAYRTPMALQIHFPLEGDTSGLRGNPYGLR